MKTHRLLLKRKLVVFSVVVLGLIFMGEIFPLGVGQSQNPLGVSGHAGVFGFDFQPVFFPQENLPAIQSKPAIYH